MRKTPLLILSGLLISQTGCGTALKRTWTELKGAEARAKGVTGAAPSGLARFRGVRIMPVRTHLAGLVDTTYKATLPSALKARLTRSADDHKPGFPGRSPVLTLDPQTTFYSVPGSPGGLFGRAAYALLPVSTIARGAASWPRAPAGTAPVPTPSPGITAIR